ncbi:TioE family transcriptional regulator [Nocardia sp. AG03]|uniref:TioE family transcriptional regulator n=1 Tax=Nocardia sp. AG03 TaxID=3025312 RepID=UPI0024183209|nr:TioE family transcriptional regulator [Nocardia sp. AG03]
MRNLRPADLAREHGLSTQAVRNYEEAGFLPAADRTPTGYRIYTATHAAALRAYLALIAAFGHATAGAIMRALHDDDLDKALTMIDRGHAQLLRDRETLAAVRRATDHLTTASVGDSPLTSGTLQPLGHPRPTRQASDAHSPLPSDTLQPPGHPRPTRRASGAEFPLPPGTRTIGELAHRLQVTPATLRAWEDAGILTPDRDPTTGYRRYDPTDLRDAELTHLLRRGGYLLGQIAEVVRQIRTAGSTEALAAALDRWQHKLTNQGVDMLDAAAELSRYRALIAR